MLMKNRILKSALTLMMVTTLIFSDSTVAGLVHATEDATETVEEVQNEENNENEEEKEVKEELKEEEPKEEEQKEEEQKEEEQKEEEEKEEESKPVEHYYKVSASAQNISFGTVYEGEYHDSQTVTIYNDSDTEVDMYCQATDSNDAFKVSLLGASDVRVGGSASLIITPKQELKEGRYSASIFVGPDQGTIASGVEVNYSVVVEKKAPYVDKVEIIPTSVCITKGSSYQFDARVYGGNNPDTSIFWSFEGSTSAGTTLSQSGKLTVDAAEKANTITVTAYSLQNEMMYASATVTLQEGYHNVSVQANPREGGNVSGGGSIPNGNNAEVYAVANNGYTFKGWSLDNKTVSTSNRYTISNVTRDMTLVANFERTKAYVLLEASPDCGGKVSGGGNFTPGNDVAITAEPANGYKFAGWKEDGKIVSKDQKYVLRNVNGTRRLTACFEQSVYFVKLTERPDNAGTLTGQGNYESGKKVTVKATAQKDYEFTGWMLDGKIISTNPEYTIDKIGRDYSLIATFAKKSVKTYEIASSVASDGGIITPEGKLKVNEGISVTYKIAPKTGYKISAVAVDGVQIGAVDSYTFTNVKANHSIAAAFEKKPAVTVEPKKDTKNTTKKDTTAKTDTNTTKQTESKTDTKTDTKTEVKTDTDTKTDTKTEITSEDSNQMPAEEQNVITEVTVVDDPDEPNVYDKLTGVLQTFNVTREQAREKLRTGEGEDLFTEAYLAGYLNVSVNNQYAASVQETADETFYNNRTITNFKEVFNAVVSEDELLDAFEGHTIRFSVNIAKYKDFIPSDKQKAVDEVAKRYDCQVADYFDIILMKSTYDNTEIIKELGAECEFVLQIPQELKDKNREYAIVRIHENSDGTIDKKLLQDLDDNPDTITFRSDRFSVYAIVYPREANTLKTILIFAIIIVALVIIFTVVLQVVRRVSRRRR